ncbi:MAG: hypothetical protein EOO38_04300 [Cytophagaceae bacterium]|nr:MAG: hypothetical protein EOO38_04300 [Cytophagaceae bacterium]
MRALLFAAIITIAHPAAAQSEWQRFGSPGSTIGVDFPAHIFTIDSGATANGYGRQFKTTDGASNLSVYSMPNLDSRSPAQYFRQHFQLSPSSAIYRRITNRFFAASGYRGNDIWYARCNFGRSTLHCVALNYPAQEKRQWDRIVARVSHSLSSP